MIKTVGVIGANQMGNGIAHLFVLHGFAVILCDISDSRLNASLAKSATSWSRKSATGFSGVNSSHHC